MPVSAGRMLVRKAKPKDEMGLPASLGKDRLSMSFHGRKEAQDGEQGIGLPGTRLRTAVPVVCLGR